MTAAPTRSALEQPDPDVRPQDDLFRHVNGALAGDRRRSQHDRSMDGAFYRLRDAAEADSRAIVEEAAAAGRAGGAEPGSTEQLIGDLYRSFMDVDTVEAAGLAPIADQLAAARGRGDGPGPAAAARPAAPGRRRRARSASTSTATRPTRIATC